MHGVVHGHDGASNRAAGAPRPARPRSHPARSAVALGIAIALFASPAFASFDSGLADYKAGRFASAAYDWRAAAEQGDARAQYRLATLYATGRGVPKDWRQAFKWFSLAAQSGNANAETSLGNLYFNGLGVDKNITRAAQWYRAAARQSQPLAQYRLALIELEGSGGVSSNPKAGARLMQAAAKAGLPVAQNVLGYMYDKGIGVAASPATAVDWYKAAALKADPLAQQNLAQAYASGRGVGRNYAWAVFWSANAVRLGNKNALKVLDANVGHLNTRQVTANLANIRAGTSTKTRVVAQVKQGAALPVLGSTNGWTQVYIAADHELGWVSSALLK